MEPGEPKNEGEKQEPDFERTSGLMRVVGASAEKEMEVLDQYKRIFDEQEGKMFQPEWEREKTDEENKLIKKVLEKLPSFVERFGGKPVPIKPKNIRFLDNEKIQAAGWAKGTFEHYDWQNQQVTLCPKGGVKTAEILVHELMHLESFMSLGYKESNGRQEPHLKKIGLGIVEKTDQNMHTELNEAITEELTIRFLREYYENPYIGKTVGSRKMGNLKYMGGIEARIREVTMLRKMISDIFLKNPDDFKSEEDVFNLFAEGYFTGNLLSIGKIIEKTYGKGSFRRTIMKGEPEEYFFHH